MSDEAKHDASGALTTDINAMSETAWRAVVAAQFLVGRERMDDMELLIADNTRATHDTKTLVEGIGTDTKQIREYLANGKTVVRVLSGLGKFMRHAYIWITSAIALYSLLRGNAHHDSLPPTK